MKTNCVRALLLWVVLVVAMTFSGCDAKKAQVGVERLNDRIVVTAESIEAAEPVILALEQTVGKSIPIELVLRGEKIAGNVEQGANVGAGIAATVAQFVPGAGPVMTALLGIGTLAGAIGGFFKRRRIANTEKALKTVLRSVDDVSGVGAKIKDATMTAGVNALVEDAYRSL